MSFKFRLRKNRKLRVIHFFRDTLRTLREPLWYYNYTWNVYTDYWRRWKHWIIPSYSFFFRISPKMTLYSFRSTIYRCNDYVYVYKVWNWKQNARTWIMLRTHGAKWSVKTIPPETFDVFRYFVKLAKSQ